MDLAVATQSFCELSDEQLIADIHSEFHAAEQCLVRSSRHVLNAGCLLIEAKARCKHGDWLPWLREHFPGSQQTASNWMRVAGAIESGTIELPESGNLPVSKALEQLGAEEKPHVTSNSGNNEWYTPVEYLDAARSVMGGIDVDPASCELAQLNVKAKRFYTAEQDGLSKQWKGRVWMNPPYAADLVAKFSEKLADERIAGRVTAAIVLVNNATETRWFESLSRVSSAICFPTGRIRYLDETGEEKNSPLQGQAFVYIGDDVAAFKEVFCAYGPCWRVL